MPSLKIDVPHSLSRDEATNRIRNLLSELQKQYGDSISGVKEQWNDNVGEVSFNAKGFDLAAKITITDSNVELDSDVPFAVSLFSGTIKNMIKEKAQELLS